MIRRIPSGGTYEEKIGYCRAVVADGWIFVSGTVGVDRQTGEVSSDIAVQCRQALDIIEEALLAAGSGFSDVVRVTYMLPDRSEFEACWPVLSATFGDAPPAATMIECGLIDPKYRIEIEVTARVPQR
ncbi:RidA family protein [Aestuariibius insulae]|uniref:RidA family protein n=1 Tax=Aestuariibius insulae TaxID=2058287 RepID=UPI00345E8792